MSSSTGGHFAAIVQATLGLLVLGALARADEITLRSGATLHGHVTEGPLPNHARGVEVETASGSRIVFERTTVKQVKRGAAAGQKTAAGQAAKPRLSPTEQAWMTTIRGLVSRLGGSNRDLAARAWWDLGNIQDPDALPGLARYLQQSPDADLRHLFLEIVRSMRGENPVYYLVYQSLFDPSVELREQARQSLGPERADSARTLYIYALKFREPTLATRAALGIQEIGDPNGDAIPYLIEALVYTSRREIVLPKTEWIPLAWSTSPDANIRIVNEHSGPAWFGQMNGPTGGRPLPAAPAQSGKTTQLPQQLVDHPDPVVAIDIPVKSVMRDKDGNSTVLDTLLKVTKLQPGFGYNRDNWRSWWTAEKASRDLQPHRADKPIAEQSRAVPSPAQPTPRP
jgi:hypothetical protein